MSAFDDYVANIIFADVIIVIIFIIVLLVTSLCYHNPCYYYYWFVFIINVIAVIVANIMLNVINISKLIFIFFYPCVAK